MDQYEFVPLSDWVEQSVEQMQRSSLEFYKLMKRRRSVRQFSEKTVPRDIIESCLKAAGTAPSGANKQPWHFAVVEGADMKRQIRVEAERVEKEFYSRRAPEYWLKDLEPLGTDENKPYLEKAAYLIAIFARKHEIDDEGVVHKHYYINESVGIATGILITAIHQSGLVCLTHTPSPMAFLRDILGRPKYETPFLLLAVGYPDPEATVPTISKKELSEIASFF